MCFYVLALAYSERSGHQIGDRIGSNSEKLFNSHGPVDRTPKKEVTAIDRRKASILLALAAVAAIVGGTILTVYAAGNEEVSGVDSSKWINERMIGRTCGWSLGQSRGWGRRGFVEVSEEFKENVVNIAKSDEDVQALLGEGYNVTGVRPIIKAEVQANGDVTMRATEAIVVLRKDATGNASVWVDLEEGKVTRIVILTRTVIEKP